jgi:hypothetical protein
MLDFFLGSWIKPLGFYLCHMDLGTIFPRYRPSQGQLQQVPHKKGQQGIDHS